MLRKCIEVVGLRRGGGDFRNLSGTASANSEFTPVSKQKQALGRVMLYPNLSKQKYSRKGEKHNDGRK